MEQFNLIQAVKKNCSAVTKFMFMFIAVFFFVACTDQTSLDVITPTLAPIPTTPVTSSAIQPTLPPFTPIPISPAIVPSIFPALSSVPTPLAAPMAASPIIAPASEIIAMDQIISIPLGKQIGVTLALDDKFVYWVENKNPGTMYRISLKGGQPEIIATSQYSDGRLDVFRPILSGRWLIFCDSPRSSNLGVWKVRVLNLDDHSEKLLLHNDGDQANLLMSLGISAQDDWVMWTIIVQETSGDFKDTMTLMNLDSGESREFMRSNIDEAIFPIISISKGWVVVEQDLEDSFGGGNNLYLLDLTNEKMQILSTDGKSSMPSLVFPWVMWKAAPRYSYGQKIVLYNLQDHRKLWVPLEDDENSDPQMNDSKIYWDGWPSANPTFNSIYIYDINKNITFVFDSPENQVFEDYVISGEYIAWVRPMDYFTYNTEAFLEWTTFK